MEIITITESEVTENEKGFGRRRGREARKNNIFERSAKQMKESNLFIC